MSNSKELILDLCNKTLKLGVGAKVSSNECKGISCYGDKCPFLKNVICSYGCEVCLNKEDIIIAKEYLKNNECAYSITEIFDFDDGTMFINVGECCNDYSSPFKLFRHICDNSKVSLLDSFNNEVVINNKTKNILLKPIKKLNFLEAMELIDEGKKVSNTAINFKDYYSKDNEGKLMLNNCSLENIPNDEIYSDWYEYIGGYSNV